MPSNSHFLQFSKPTSGSDSAFRLAGGGGVAVLVGRLPRLPFLGGFSSFSTSDGGSGGGGGGVGSLGKTLGSGSGLEGWSSMKMSGALQWEGGGYHITRHL